ncbi:13676_t:CDS:2 [Acaulospora colombiana]|uniref:13676_t:CDS:1 n=1 Tax=Acaulospora colombiana TaxID=27376 RepID=A0ACA9PEG4_9GLOM|nr:13676_t:CDS:2 [Acaulospora colombiana]
MGKELTIRSTLSSWREEKMMAASNAFDEETLNGEAQNQDTNGYESRVSKVGNQQTESENDLQFNTGAPVTETEGEIETGRIGGEHGHSLNDLRKIWPMICKGLAFAEEGGKEYEP